MDSWTKSRTYSVNRGKRSDNPKALPNCINRINAMLEQRHPCRIARFSSPKWNYKKVYLHYVMEIIFTWQSNSSKGGVIMKIGIIIGSTRPGRNSEAVGKWIYDLAQQRNDDAQYELVDIADFNLPLLDEPMPPSFGQYEKEHTKKWAAKIDSFDGYIFVTPEYNHATSGALKNAIDFLYKEWNNKAAGFVGIGSTGGTRAVENLRLIMGELQVADVRSQVALSLFTDFENFSVFKPGDHHLDAVNSMFDQVLSWSKALKTVR